MEQTGFTWKNPVAVGACILPIFPFGSLVTAVPALQTRQKSATGGGKLQKLLFSQPAQSAKYLLKCAAHSEAKLELAAAPAGTRSWQSAAPCSSPGCCGRTASPLEKQPPIFFSLHDHVSHYCAAAPEEQMSVPVHHHRRNIISSPTTCTQWLPTSGAGALLQQETGGKEQRPEVVLGASFIEAQKLSCSYQNVTNEYQICFITG